MKLNEFLDKFEDYQPRVVEVFEHQWPSYKEMKAYTFNIAFEGQSDNDCGVSITSESFNGEIIDADILFQDAQVIYVRPDIILTYHNECKNHCVDINGTSNMYEFGDYIPSVYLDIEAFSSAVTLYAESCDMGTPFYIGPGLKETDDSCVWKWSTETSPAPDEPETEPESKNYRVVFNVRIEYPVESAVNMDDALAQASEALYNDLDFMFDNDAIIVRERAVFETVNGDDHA